MEHYFSSLPMHPYWFNYPYFQENYESQNLVVKQESEEDVQIYIRPEIPVKCEETEQNLIDRVEASLKKMHKTKRNFKNHWTKEEDEHLLHLVNIQKKPWKVLPKYLKNRNSAMCYGRYRRLINESFQDKAWTPQVKEFVVDFVQQYGYNWSALQKKLPQFTAKKIRERYFSELLPGLSKTPFTYQQDLTIIKFVLEIGTCWKDLKTQLKDRSQNLLKCRWHNRLRKIVDQAKKMVKTQQK